MILGYFSDWQIIGNFETFDRITFGSTIRFFFFYLVIKSFTLHQPNCFRILMKWTTIGKLSSAFNAEKKLDSKFKSPFVQIEFHTSKTLQRKLYKNLPCFEFSCFTSQSQFGKFDMITKPLQFMGFWRELKVFGYFRQKRHNQENPQKVMRKSKCRNWRSERNWKIHGFIFLETTK